VKEILMSIRSSAKLSLLAASVLALASQAALAGAAGPTLPPGKSMAQTNIGPLTHDSRKLLKTYVSQGNGGALAAGAFNFVESRTVDCPKAGGCHIGQEAMVQLNPGGGNWAICTSVNAVYTTCQFQGHLPDVGTFVVGNSRGFVAVPQGVHTVQTDVFVSNASTLAQWQTDHRTYSP
jgi:hypothetical protein